MTWIILILIWLIICTLIAIPLGQSLYQRCHSHLKFSVQWNATDDPLRQRNSRRKIILTMTNEGAQRLLIKEVGIYNTELDDFYPFHKLIDTSAPLPVWMNQKDTLSFAQYTASIDQAFLEHHDHLRLYAKDSQNRYYYSN